MQDYAEKVRTNIASHGFHTTYVLESETPAFCYSTGIFQQHGIPELFISALPPNLSHELIKQYIARFQATGPEIGTRVSAQEERFDYYLINVSNERLSDYVLATIKYYGDSPYQYLQLVYPDTEMRFPHEPGYDYDQELLGEFPG